MPISSRKLCVAPMMDWTDRHCRYFHRLLSRDAVLYTEMVTTEAVLHGDRDRLLAFDEAEHPVALQLGGSVPERLAEVARIGEAAGYDEINLNVGCPSDRVQEGRFGACLMADPELVRACVAGMASAVEVPVTVKCRIGIDEQDAESDFANFVEIVAQAPCRTFIVHARKAWLSGLSPRENRDVPPLDYERVYRLKRSRPGLEIIINGGIDSVAACEQHLAFVDGVMLGRAAYQSPFILAEAQERVCSAAGEQEPLSREEVLSRMIFYVERHVRNGGRLNNVTRHVLGLYKGKPGARAFRRYLSENATGLDATVDVLVQAIEIAERRAVYA